MSRDDLKSNFVCRSCDAKLLAVRIPSPYRPDERAFCPHCGHNLPPRDADDLIQFHLVKRPSPPRSFVPNADWYGPAQD